MQAQSHDPQKRARKLVKKRKEEDIELKSESQIGMIIERNTCSEEFQLAGLADMPIDMFSRPLSTDIAPLSYDDS